MSSPLNPSAASNGESLETIFFKATSPIHKSADPNLQNLFCSRVNAEPEGHLQAIRLISHKIQSPQEHEALRTLELLEVCVNTCGRRFHQEIGKFRFLNEMIKLVSPKYLANHTSEKVKKKVIEILFSWTQSLPTEVKIGEAYQMLKRQAIITEDPVLATSTPLTPVPQRTKSIFDQDEEKSKTLQKLLKSRKPEDLEQANALIKSLVKKDEEKIEKLSNRASEMEKIQNNIRVLSEMLIHYNHSTVTEPEKETMIYLHEELEKLRPILFRLATESEDDDEGLGEILAASDALSRVLAQYYRLVQQDNPGKDDSVLPFFDEIVPPPAPSSRTLIDLGEQQAKSSPRNELDDLFGPASSSQTDDCQPIFPLSSTNNRVSQLPAAAATASDADAQRKKGGLFDDLQDLLVDHSTGQKIPPTKSSFQSTSSTTGKTPLSELFKSTEVEYSFPSIALESIRPSSKHPSIQLKLNSSTGVQCVLHFARDSPRVDLIPLVLTVTNTNTSKAISNFQCQVKVNKNVRVQLQPPSAHDLPAYNPILPAQALTQIILLANPQRENIRFAYQITYSLQGEAITESAEIEQGFPIAMDLI